MSLHVIAIDIDGVLDIETDFFQISISLWQKAGIKVGILTSRSESDKKPVADVLEKCGLKMDFLIFMPDEFKSAGLPPGVWKGILCRLVKADILFDDFQRDDPQFVADFSEINKDTRVFTPVSLGGQLDADNMTTNGYAERLVEALEGKIKY